MIEILFLPDITPLKLPNKPIVIRASITTHRVILAEEWKEYPFAYNGCFGAICDKKLIIGGGTYSDGQPTMKVFEESDITVRKFEPIMPLNYRRAGASAAYSPWHRKLIIAGGTSRHLGGFPFYELHNVELLNTENSTSSESSSLSSSRWIACSDKMNGTLGSNVEVFSLLEYIVLVDKEYNKIYKGKVLEGRQQNGKQARDRSSKQAPLSGISIEWESLPAMNKPRYNFSTIVLDNKWLVCIGGHTISEDKCAKSWEFYRPESNKWTIGGDLPLCLQDAQLLSLDVKNTPASMRCIVIGGIRDHTISSCISMFDFGNGHIIDFKDKYDRDYALKFLNIKDKFDVPKRCVGLII